MATSFFPNDLIIGKPCSVVDMCEYTGLRAAMVYTYRQDVNLKVTNEKNLKLKVHCHGYCLDLNKHVNVGTTCTHARLCASRVSVCIYALCYCIHREKCDSVYLANIHSSIENNT